jgi:hypothetical protein
MTGADPTRSDAAPASASPHLKTMLESLLGALVLDGVDNPPADWARIASSRHLTASEFATEVLLAAVRATRHHGHLLP